MSDNQSGLKSVHPQYTEHQSNWQMVRDLIKGQKALKERDLRGLHAALTSNPEANKLLMRQISTRYLPIPNAGDCDDQGSARYAQYVQRASLFNATRRTLNGMTGMVFSKPTKLELPESVSYLEDDADGSGVGINEQATEVLDDVLATARDALFVDYPVTEGETTVADQEAGLIRASIIVYKAEHILDWATITENSKQKLSFVKLLEHKTVRDGLKVETVEQIRVLMLNPEGIYVNRIYTDPDNFTEVTPQDANSKQFTEIPFFFIGATNNRPNVDTAPLLEIAEVNIAHYRNSADFEEAAFLVGQPTLVISGLTQAWVNENMSNGINFGSRAGIPLPKDSSADLLQAQETNMSSKGMEMKEKQMISLGARLITDGGQAETAEAARIKHSADGSVLSVAVRNINLAYKDAIAFAHRFNSGSDLPEFEFSINLDFFAGKLAPQQILFLVQAWQAGAFDKATLDKMLIDGKVFEEDIDLETMNANIENEAGDVIDFDDEDDDPEEESEE